LTKKRKISVHEVPFGLI